MFPPSSELALDNDSKPQRTWLKVFRITPSQEPSWPGNPVASLSSHSETEPTPGWSAMISNESPWLAAVMQVAVLLGSIMIVPASKWKQARDCVEDTVMAIFLIFANLLVVPQLAASVMVMV